VGPPIRGHGGLERGAHDQRMTVCGPGGQTDFIEIPPESMLPCREREVPLRGTSGQGAKTDKTRGVQGDAKTRNVADGHRTLDNHDDLAPMHSHHLAERAQTRRRDLYDIVDDDHRGCAISWSVVSPYRAQVLDGGPKSTLGVATVPEHELPTALSPGKLTKQRRTTGSIDACEHDVPAFIE
jgi:hypothetical protein